jgi:tetratricopeptide (TPR) repeat protein
VGQEIERARVLVRALTHKGVLKAEDAGRAYEAWVANAEDQAFSRFLIESEGAKTAQVQEVLRLLAVRGLPNPEAFTFERFEDLLVGQLAIEAGMLNSKLLRSVRAVQDKKAAEGKLRRLSDLLPRAGFDKNMLDLLMQHLEEQVMLCRGCLGRYPRKDLGQLEVVCPRCGATITAEELEPSEEVELSLVLSSEQQQALAASSEHVIGSLTVRDRERRATQRTSERNPMVAVVVLLLFVIGAGAVGISLLESEPTGVPVSRRPLDPGVDAVNVEPGGGDSGSDSDSGTVADGGDTPGTPTVASARQQDTEFVAAGRFADMLKTWRAVEPAAGEDPAEVRGAVSRRVEYLEKMLDLATQAEKGVAAAAAGAVTPSTERELARVLRASPPNHPAAFGDLANLLRRLQRDRVANQTAAAETRLNEAKDALSEGENSQEWGSRAAAVSGSRPLMGVMLDGARVEGVRVLEVSAPGFRIGTNAGERKLAWEEQPPVSLQVFQAVADKTSIPDQIEVLRFALAARDSSQAFAAAEGLEIDRAAVERLLSAAPTSSPLARVNSTLFRVRYPLRWSCSDLVPSKGATVKPSRAGLALEGGAGRCELVGATVATVERERKQAFRIAALCRLGPGAKDPFLVLRLIGKGAERAYRARWNSKRWSLVVTFGSEETAVASGSFERTPDLQRARLEFTGKEIVFALGGAALARANVWTKCKRAALSVGAAGPLLIEELLLEGSLDPAAAEVGEREYRDHVKVKLDRLRVRTRTSGEVAALSVEDPQELALSGEDVLQRLSVARDLVLRGELPKGIEALRAVRAEDPNLLSAPYYEAYARLRQRDYSAALTAVNDALQKQPAFPEAKTLKGLILSLAGRSNWAGAVEAGLGGRIDLPHGYLARAWALSRPRAKEGGGGAEAELSLAVALGLDDPFVEEVAQSIRDGNKLLASLPSREAGSEHLVYAATPELAKLAVKRLDSILGIFAKRIGRDRKARRLPVAVLSSAAFRARAGSSASGGVYDRRLGWLLLDGAPPKAKEIGGSVARALAAAFCARRYGAAPPWLELGVIEFLAEAAIKGPAEDHVKILRNDGRWDPSTWGELFALDRVGLRGGQRITVARCWVMFAALKPARFAKHLTAAQRGKIIAAPALNVPKVEDAIAKFLEGIKLPEDE